MHSGLTIGVDPITGTDTFEKESVVVYSVKQTNETRYYITDLFHFQFTLLSSLNIENRNVMYYKEPIYQVLFESFEEGNPIKVDQTIIWFLENEEEYSDVTIG